MNEFLHWARENGCQIDGIEVIRDAYGGNTLSSIKPVEVIIPKSVCLSLGMLRGIVDEPLGSTLKAWSSSRVGLSFQSSASLLLILHYRGYRSFWSPYFDIFNKPDSILKWTQEEELLIGTTLEGYISHQRGLLTSLLKYYQSIHSLDISEDEWIEANGIIASRVIHADEELLVPVVDLSNHSLDQNASWRQSKESVILDCRGTGEVRFSYGVRGNAELLMTYGFVEQSVSRKLVLEYHHQEKHGLITLSERDVLDENQEFVQEYGERAEEMIQQLICERLNILSQSERSDALQLLASRIDPERLAKIDLLRDSERALLISHVQQ